MINVSVYDAEEGRSGFCSKSGKIKSERTRKVSYQRPPRKKGKKERKKAI